MLAIKNHKCTTFFFFFLGKFSGGNEVLKNKIMSQVISA